MRRVLRKKFFNRPAPDVCLDLLGKFLVQKVGFGERAFEITEVEAYEGLLDRGSHAHKGLTKSNWPMFGPAGFWYVYFTYGMHWMLNIVTGEEDHPSAILIRGVRGIKGPGRVTKNLGINNKLNGAPAVPLSGLWIEDRGAQVDPKSIKKGPRIGIDYAGPFWKKRKWRFYITD